MRSEPSRRGGSTESPFLDLIEVLRTRAEEQPQASAFTFLAEGEDESCSLTYAELDRRARALAATLQSLGVAGERGLLLFPPGLEYISAFWGCLYAGVVAVPAYPPRARDRSSRLRALVADAEPAIVLTPTAVTAASAGTTGWQALAGAPVRWLATDEVLEEAAADWQRSRADARDLAFLQYTSGSTSAPKGVQVTHGNLLHNEEMIRAAFGQSRDSVVVGWLPLYHDMGLIGNVLQPIYSGGRCILMPPLAFLQKPVRWLEAISRYRATTSGGPDFAYELCVRKVSAAQRDGLDLASWRVAFNGAEPVRAETLERFAAAFAPSGFRRAAFYPCYGLAEATLFVAGGGADAAPALLDVDAAALQEHRAEPTSETAETAESRTLAGCGHPWHGQRVAIADPADPETGRELPPGRVGEIWVAGPSVAAGYWRRPEETARTFGAALAGGEGPFLRTGDLGFIRDGELFVTGRVKDLIILRGRNHYPQDLERTAERSHPALRPGCGAAFEVEVEGEARLVIVQEIDRRREAEAAAAGEAARRAVAEEHELQVHELVLARAGAVPKTSSGKIRRQDCRAAWQAGALEVIWRSGVAGVPETGTEPPDVEPADLPGLSPEARRRAVEALVRREAARLLPGGTVPADVPLTALGLDSLAAVELRSSLESGAGVTLSLRRLLEGATLAQVAAEALDLLDAGGAASSAAPMSFAADPRPLTPGEESLWLADRLAPGRALYNLAAAARTEGELDPAALRRACEALVARHPALRSTFPVTEGGPRVRRGAAIVDFALGPGLAAADDAQEILGAEAWRPFDLANGPLLRVRVWPIGEDGGHLLLVVLHHLVADFASVAVLARELAELYREERGAEAARLGAPDPGVVAVAPAGEREEHLWDYWRHQLAGELPVLDLATDFPRRAVPGHAGGAVSCLLGEELLADLRAVGRAHGATLFVVLLAGFQALLERYTGQPEVVIGAPTAGRSAPGQDEAVGYFVNPVPLRLAGGVPLSFAERVDRAREVALAAFEHQDFPLAWLIERLRPERPAGRSPLFQALLVLQQDPVAAPRGLAAFSLGMEGARVDLGGLVLTAVPLGETRTPFDLTLWAAEAAEADSGGLALSLQYGAELFAPATARRMLEHLAGLLRTLAVEPWRRPADVELLSEAERRQLAAWNDTGSAGTPETTACLHELFAAQAVATPDAVALVWGEERWSYAGLAAWAGSLAGALRRRGVGPEVRVGLCAERTPELVAGMLAVLAAGGAYVPLDPTYPAERLRFLLEDSRASVLLAPSRLVPNLPVAGLPLVPLDEAMTASSAPSTQGVPANLAYLIYTSGSTGRPKGVAIAHASAAALVSWTQQIFAGDEIAGVLAGTSIGFDLSVFEILVPLCRGGRVILADSVLALPSLPAAAEVTLVNGVPSVVSELVRAGGLPAGAATVCLAGEPLRRDLVDRLFALPGVRRVCNLYGPSEDTTYSTYAPQQPGAASEPPIGRPIAGTRVHLVDRSGSGVRVPPGVPGELCLAGEGLARGYDGRPELTAERFVPDPWGEAGGRLYRTGDLARLRPDGELDFLGRLDEQVKVRGFRIEPGEIEAALLRHPAVAEAVVVARRRDGETVLAAYAGVPGGESGSGELRRWLAAGLPAHMVPARLAVVPALPRTPNGKVDRKALPALDGEPVAAETVAPRTVVEELLAGLWAGALGVERVGITDDFFALGGHSLLAARVLAQVRDILGVELPLGALLAAPTVEALAGAVERARTAGTPSAPPLTPADRTALLPLSFAQERLWFLDRLAPGSPAYNMPAAVRLRGGLSPAALARALAAVAGRHEVLRTSFGEVAGTPCLRVSPAVPFLLSRIDLAALAPAAREAEALRLAAAEARRPFDLAAGPLLRQTLVRLGEEEHLLLLTLHHAVADGWSLGLFAGELAACYSAALRSEEPALPALPVQYADYAVWQRRWLAGEALASRLDWWRRHLAGAPVMLELPADRPRPAVRSFRGGVEPVAVAVPLERRLREQAAREGVTLFMLLLAGHATLLRRYGGQEDLVVGAAVANRDRSELSGLIGLFVNSLPLRIGFAEEEGGAPSLTWRELLRRVRGECLAAFAWQDLPFERLVEELRPQRDLSSTPLFQTLLVLRDGRAEAPRLAGVEASVESLHRLHNGTAKLDLTLSLAERDGVLAGELEYSADLFDGITVRRLGAHLLNLLESAAADPDGRVAELPWLDAAERRQLIADWNGTAAPYPRQTRLHELFELQAERTPEATAIVGAERWSYRDLDRRADRLARRLRALGVGPEALVGVFTSRTPDMVAAVLAVLKAGGAYLPLDPAYPRERLAFLLADSGAPVVLTESALAPALPPFGGAMVLLDGEGDAAEGPLDAPGDPEQLAYVIYTSGSTGVPKAVAIRHASAVAMVAWALSAYPPERLAGVLAATSLCFDLSVFELFVPLAAGGAVILADDVFALPELPARGEVTLVNTVPSGIDALLRAGALPPSVRTVNLAGEPLRRELAARLYALPHVAEVYNLYGPSEDTTYSTGVLVGRAEQGEPTIGRPLANARAYVLAPAVDALEPAPVGVPGELWLGGEGLARGYLGRPEQTADRFRPDPFAAAIGCEAGGRLYRTGDRARRRGDGDLEFLGRLDHQVKLRGFRIELGEVEAAMSACAGIAEAVAVVREDVAGDLRLTAYVAGNPGIRPDLEELRAALAAKLPAYMVPTAWMVLDRLPRTPNGKIDRKLLPRPDGAGADRVSGVPPATPVEETLAEIWADLLGVERVGRHDDFFALGGHSLLAARVVARVAAPFGVDLPLRAVFEHPTVARLAAAVERGRGVLPEVPPVFPMPQALRAETLPLSFAQERLWFLDQLAPGSPVYNLPAGLWLDGALRPAVLAAALTEVVRRHESLRTRFTAVGGRPRQVVQPPAPVPLPEVDLAALPDARQAALRLAAAAARRPFDLARGPLLRALLLRLGGGSHLLFLGMHHIVTDGRSIEVLMREIAALYPALAGGEASPLPEPGLQYADFAVWQRRWLDGGVLGGQLAFWREHLAGAPAALELPLDRPRPAVQRFRGGHRRRELPAGLTGDLRRLGRREGATLFVSLLAAVAALLSRYSGQDDLVVGAPVANRVRPELADLIGFFANTLALRLRIAPGDGFGGLLARARRTALAAYAHQDVPFERVVEELQVERSLDRSPLFQAMAVLWTAPVSALRLPGLELAPAEIDAGATKVDLTLRFQERGPALGIEAEYDADLFDGVTVERWLAHLEHLLAEAVAHPERRLDGLPLASAERHQLLAEWNDTLRMSALPDLCLHELFAVQAARTPEALAVVCGGRRLTFGELRERSGRLTRHLLRLGLGLEARVGLLLPRSVAGIAGILAILEAGGAYVPLDPAAPRERLALLLAEAGVAAVLTVEALRSALPATGLPVLCLDALPEEDGAEEAPGPRVGPSHLAYVLYTSGSTGRPKGVMVEHRSVVNLAAALRASVYAGLAVSQSRIAGSALLVASPTPSEASGLKPTSDSPHRHPEGALATEGSGGGPFHHPGPSGRRTPLRMTGQGVHEENPASLFRSSPDQTTRRATRQLHRDGGLDEPLRVAVNAPLTFDASVKQWIQLLFGHTLCIPTEEERLDPARLLAFLRDEAVQVLDCTPSQLAALLDAGLLAGPAPLRILVGGEEIPRALWQLLAGRGTTRFFNVYGPTECTVDTAVAPVAVSPGASGPALGRPLANVRVHVLSPGLEAVPAGAAGELCIAGAGLARGYLGAPAQTAERFVPNPWPPTSETRGERLYRSGDRVRFLPDGRLEFLGRTDQQVKVRGVRIEPGEIESALAAHPAVREAAVLAPEAESGERRLVALYTVAGEPAVDPGAVELREFLRGRLPEAMVPSAFVPVAAMPWTPNGKLDRRALLRLVPAPGRASGWGAGQTFVAPRTADEALLTRLWGEVLGVDRVGADDDFFALGGHSLLATQLVSRVRELCQVELPLRSLFEAPTPARLATRIEAARYAAGTFMPPPVVPVPRDGRDGRDGELPLSFSQVREWFLDQLEPGSPAYNVAERVRLRGPLAAGALARALDEVVRRHEALRTRFPATDGRPSQVIVAGLSLVWPLVDLAGLPAAQREEEARRLAVADTLHSFDLARGPLFKASLLRLGAEDHVLLVNMHHIVSDGWSMGVLIRELGTLYADFLAGGQPSLPELPVQYADYAVWQRRWLQGEVLERQLAWWRHQLGDGSPPLALPADRPRPAVASHRGAEVPFALSAELSQRLGRLAAGSGVSLFMLLLAAFQALLHRRTGERDVSVGTFIANRTRAETEPLIGFFVNTLVLRARPAPEIPFQSFLEEAGDRALDAYAHQDLPFERLIEELQPARDLSYTPLFQAMLVLQNAPGTAVRFPGLAAEPLRVATTRSNFDLTLWLWEGEGGLEGTLHYSRDLFEAPTAVRLLEHFRVLLAGVEAAPSLRLGEIPLLTEGERHQLLWGWNDTASALPAAPPVQEQIARAAAATPDAVAVVAGEEAITYGELLDRSLRLARHLRRLGVGPEVRAGLCAERSLEMVVGILGVLLAGGGYVPIDPATPRERMELMLADSGAAVLLTQERLLPLPVPPGVRVVPLDRPATVPPLVPALLDEGWDASVAYVIYTSGSTGRPKGVLVPHGGLASYTRSAIARFGIAPGDRVLQFASVSFDASAEEIYPCLASGATLVLRDEEMLGTVATFFARCEAWELTVLDLPTAWWHELTAGGPANNNVLPGCVRLVILGGERALPERWARFRETAGTGVRLANTYGPTEATVVATLADLGLPVRHPWGWEEAAIGRPVTDVLARVLDPLGNPRPVGVPGELCLGGAGVVRGYLGDSRLTAARFVPDAFGSAGSRLYRTGDLVRLLADGRLEFLGRIDNQVKIRGFRVETGEIEAVLAEHPAVAQAAVIALEDIAREDAPGVRRLIAYVVASAGDPLSGLALRAHLAARLPEYMLPAAFVELPSLPRTASGKIDRNALPRPELDGLDALEIGGRFVAPRTPTEEVVAGVWAEVLGRERVGVRDNFFELGGHSLIATRIMARLQEIFPVELPLRAFFEAPTVEELAERLESAGQTRVPPTHRVIRRVPRGGDLPTSFPQERIWFLAQLDPSSTSYHVPRSVRIRGRVNVTALRHAYRGLLDRHEILRTVFPEVEGRPMQRIRPPAGPGPFPLPVIDLRRLPAAVREREAARLVLADASRLFDLQNGPLLRAYLARLDEEEHLLFQTEHHLVHDGWAEAVLLGDLLELYAAAAEGRRPALPELAIQFADFAVWQREWLQGEVLDEQLAYWTEHLAGAPPLLELPADRPRPPVRSSRGAAIDITLPARLVRALTLLGRRQGITLFMAMLAGFEAMLSRATGQEDLVLGLGIANRRRRETEGMLGMVINSLAVRTDLSGDPAFGELLQRVRDVCLGAYAHQDLPFDRLVEALRPERSLSHAPVFQVLFAFHDADFPDMRLAGLELEPANPHNRSAKFDMVLVLTPVPERDTGRGGEPGGLVIHTEYSTDLFDAPTVRRLIGHLQILLEGVVADSGRPLSEIELLTPAERHQAVAEWNDMAGPYDRDRRLEELFAAQAARTPEAVAVVAEGVVWSYGELAARTDRLAGLLAELGVRRGDLVGVRLSRGAGMVQAVLGILKAGGAYVPIESSFPEARARWILSSLGVRHLVTESGLAAAMSGLLAGVPDLRHLICLEPPAGTTEETAPAVPPGLTVWTAADLERRPVLPPRHDGRAGDLAYIIFTSGSTGAPKGVMVRHRPVVNVLDWVNTTFAVGPADRVLFITSLGFDLSVYDIFGLLAVGGSIRVAGDAEVGEPARLVAALGSEPLTIWDSAPAALQQLAPHFGLVKGTEGAGHLRVVLQSGDWIPVTLPDEVRSTFPAARVVSLGGATEATIWSNWYPIAAVDPAWASIPYGRPIRNARYHILDRGLLPCPIGVAGDLYIGGECLASGYAGDPVLTAGKFVPDPFAEEPGAVLYRTGDRARFWTDGTMQFLGRLDHQVKIRGFRIELGEIESVLSEHAGVRDAAVLVREDRPGDRRLVAYVVRASDEGDEVEAAELRDFLRERLPVYMVPAALVFLAALPVTSNGKLDRKALSAPEAPDAEAEGRGFVAPRTAAERELAAIWGELLGVEAVGAGDDFFALGGHSLIATQMVAEVRRRLGAELALRTLFESPTLGALAAVLEESLAERGGTAADAPPPAPELPVVVPEPAARHLPFPLNDVQQAYWLGRTGLFELGGVSSHGYMELDVSGLDVERLEQALQRLVERHDMLRTIFLPDGRQQVLAEVPPLEIEVLDLRGAPDIETPLAEVRQRMSHQVLPGDSWPLFDIRASRLTAERSRLHISRDALIADAWSFNLLTREVLELYGDPAAALPAIDLSFRDYVLAENAFKGTELYRAAERYWEERLESLPPAPELPLAKSPSSLAKVRFARRRSRLEADSWERLKERGSRRGLTPSGLIMACFAEVLAAWSKSPRFTLNVTLFNRLPLHPQVDRIVGDFTSMVLLAVDGAAGETFEQRARRVQERLWQDLDHRYVSGIEVLRRLARARRLPPGTLMPVVLTSTLTLPTNREGAQPAPLQAEPVYGISQTPQVWLDHQVGESAGELVFNWDAVEEIFPPGLLDDLFGAYRALLRQLSDPDGEEAWGATSGAGPRLLPERQLQVRAAVNATAAPLPVGLLHGGFEEQARRRPEALAVVAGDRRLSYGELLRRSAATARRLRALGARPNRLVAVVMEKGWEQVVAVLGVLQAGAAYLPISADLPRERVASLLARGEVELALTQPHLAARLEWPAGVTPLVIGEEEPDLSADIPPPALSPVQGPDDLAYVIFTSGSTGEPKGVMIDHRGALNTVADVNARFAVGPDDRVLGLSSLSFDLSVWDIFGTLAAGGTLVLPEPEAARDPARWARLVAGRGVTVWNSVPSLLEMLVEHVEHLEQGAAGSLASLRLVLLSGDWIPLSLPDRLRRLVPAVPGALVVSLGGATEASIWSILHPIEQLEPDWTSIPYGRPMVNQSFAVLDSRLEPRPEWVPGELYIGGAGVARGYWRDGERTAASFRIDPRTGERLYRTGDLGRYKPDGTIEFLGREDQQVKIQGYRIELGEIEAALLRHPRVQSAVVVALGEPRGLRRLVAYAVPDEPPAPAPRTARSAGAEGSEVVAAELEHLELKMSQPGLRRGDEDRLTVLLPEAGLDLAAAGELRRSHRRFLAGELPLAALGRLLGTLGSLELDGFGLPKYRYPSASHLYPVQVYLAVKPGRVEGLAGGIYYYHPVEHALIRLHDGEVLAREDYGELNRPVFDEAAFALLLVARPQILEPIYGEPGWRFVQIEAGAMGQLLMMAAPEEGVGLCPIGNVDFARVRERFAAGEEALCVHSFLGGRVAGAVAVAGEAPAVDLPAAQWPTGLPAGTARAGESQLPPALARLELQMSQPGVRRDLHDLQGRPALPLARPPLDGAHVAAYAFRRSHRQLLGGDAGELAPEQLAGLLGGLRQFQPPSRPLPRALYPSAGNLYPVQVYVHLKADRVAGMRGGIYYYHPKDHRLVLLEEGVEIGAALHAETNRVTVESSAFTLFLIGDLRAIEPIYGPLALDFCHLEAGYMLQLLMTLSPAHRLGLCPIGRLRFGEVRESFHLSDRHVLLHTLAGGPVAGPAVSLWPAVRLAAAPQEEAPAGALADDLRAFLRTQLPPYMVPASLVLLSSLPLTSNGKVDRKALPDPDVAASRQAASRRQGAGPEGPATPETEMESTLYEIFRDVLGSERRIGIDDNFFDLGGTSLHLVRVHGRLQQMLGRELPLLQIFNHPTIRLLAQFLGRTLESSGDEPAPFRLDEERVERLRGGTDLLRRRLAQRRTEMEAE